MWLSYSVYGFELPKLPEIVDGDDGLKLWLTLFNAETEEDLAKIEAVELQNMRDDKNIETTVKRAATCQSLAEFQKAL